ncbi:MAG TPA: FG-GAP-like repeat-containing protein, partial [Pyrinomonadaceae bacterium]
MLPITSHKSNRFCILSFSLIVFCFVNLCGWQAARAKIRPDGSYAPVLGKHNFGPSSVLLLPDEKILAIRLAAQNILGTQEYKVTRFNADGSIDRIFDSVVMNAGEGKLLLQPDGKIVVVFFNIFASGVNRGGVVRLNADGTLDTSFNASWLMGVRIGIAGALLQPDGRIVVGGYMFLNGYTQDKIVRVNADGSRDLTFSDNANGIPLALQPDGKVLANSGYGSDNPMHRLNADGTPDLTFYTNLPSSWATGHVNSIIVQPDNKIVVGGADITRLNPDGTRDTSFQPGLVYNQYQIYGMVRQPDGKISIGGNPYFFNIPSTITRKRLTRINADGTPDDTFDAMTGEEYGFDNLTPLVLRPNGTLLASGNLTQNNVARNSLVSLNQNGSIDQTFSADFGKMGGSAVAAVKQADGKILVAGDFIEADNFPASGLTRVNLDGTTDTGFNLSSQISGRIDAVAVQTDGKILIGGNFRFNNRKNYGVFRLNPNGSIDSGFTPNILTPAPNIFNYPFGASVLALQPNGKILVGGNFLNYGNSGRDKFLRLNTDGTVDASYNVTGSGQRMLTQSDGKIVVVGTLTENGNTRNNPRLNTDGSFDPAFNVPASVGEIFDISSDGKFASATSVFSGSHSAARVFRLNSDGSQDSSFTPTDVGVDAIIRELIFQPDGKMLVNINPDSMRLKLNGGIETYFDRSGINVRKFLISADNKLIVVGGFSRIGSANRTGIARFLLDGSDFDFDGDGKADISLFRPSVGDWYILRSLDGASFGTNFGLQNDLIAPADFDGDGKTDIAVFRPSDGGWYRLSSLNNTFSALQFGLNGDIPVPGDFDGDGKA